MPVMPSVPSATLPLWYARAVTPEEKRVAREARAAARRATMTVEVVAVGQTKPSPYANSSPEERLAAAVRLIQHHQALRGAQAQVPRSEWPGETFVHGGDRD